MENGKPIEKAVAILYDEAKGAAPKVVASGKGTIAAKIVETARAAGVHIQEDPNLVEVLSKIPIGNEIPVELYQTVGEFKVYVLRVNDNVKDNMRNRMS